MNAPAHDAADGSLPACRDVLRRHARTFSLASLFLPAAQRDDAAVIYAWCRAADDAVDEADGPEQARAQLAAFRRAHERATPGLARAFRAVEARCGIPEVAALDLLAGVGSDLGRVRLADDAELVRYGYRVAGTVGLMMCGVMGVRHPAAAPFAIDLGVAMQITNICRDVAEDAERDRVYLPAARLRARGVEPDAVALGRADPAAVAGVVSDLLALADRYYASARAGMHFIPLRPRLAIAAAARVYRAIGAEIRRDPHAALQRRAVVPAWRKAAELGRALGWAPFARLASAPHSPALHAPLQPALPAPARLQSGAAA